LKTVGTNRIAVDPYPFDIDPLPAQLVRRRLDRNTFADTAAFREVYFKATPEAVVFTFCSR
jgi:hypothetical protein